MNRSILLTAMFTVVVSGALLVTAGCDSNDPGDDWMDIAEVRISPDSAAIPVGETVDFSFALLTATGDTVRGVELNTRWESTDTSVFSVNSTGLATAKATGTAKCVIEASSYPLSKSASEGASMVDPSGTAAVMGFVGQDSARVVVF